ncbi:MAG: hypothetical protein IKM52_06140, partial [Clostridia bacterium]|nr:hypothetical protein [Clostridia bacterium]
ALEEHYELPDDPHATQYDAPALYRLVLGEEPSEAVLSYLTYMSGVRFFVSDSVTANVRASYRDGFLTVEAASYTYTAKNGAVVTFLPETLSFGEYVLPFESEDGTRYSVKTACSEENADSECTVTYKARFTVGDAVLEELLNGAFRSGKALLEAQENYDRAYAAYEKEQSRFESYGQQLDDYYKQKELYDAYEKLKAAYESDLAVYKAYLAKKAAYDATLEKYELYEKAKEEYEKKKEKYDQYLLDCEQYEKDRKKYKEISAQRESELIKLKAIDSAYYGTEDCDSMYVTLMGETVSLVVSQKETILKYAGDWDGLPNAIDTADASTKRLNELLPEYKDFQKDDDKYNYYSVHYQELVDNFCSLYSSLDHLFDNPVVQDVLKKNDRYERYKEFLAQLFILLTCLDDSVTLDTSVVIADGDRICDLIVDGRLITDTNRAKPSLAQLPALMAEPKAPTVVEKPEKPKTVTHPGDAPPAVDEPTAPEELDVPAMPDEVIQPIPPSALQRSDLEEQLYQAVKSGTLSERALPADASFSLACTVAVIASVPERVTVSYYDADGKSLLSTTRVEKGKEAFYGGVTPFKPSDPYADYEFIGFFDAKGNEVEDGTVFSADTYLYAKYRKIPITYTVTFSVDGKKYTSTYSYCQMPTAPTDTEKKSNAQYHYVFDGWDSAVSYVSGDAEYAATYREVLRTYKVSFVAKEKVLFQAVLPYGAIPEYNGVDPEKKVTDRYIESFARWSPRLASVTQDAVYTAVYRQASYGYDDHNQPLSAVMKENNVLEIENTTDAFHNGDVFAYAAESKIGLRLRFSTGDVFISHENVRALIDADAISVLLTEDGVKRNFRVLFKNSAVSVPNLSFELTLDVSSFLRDDATFKIYEVDSDGTRKPLFFTLKDGKAVLNLRANTQILLANEFHIGVIVGGNPTESPTESDGAPSLEPDTEMPTEVLPSEVEGQTEQKASVQIPDQYVSAMPSTNDDEEKPTVEDGTVSDGEAQSERQTEAEREPVSGAESETPTEQKTAPPTFEPIVPDGEVIFSSEGGSVSADCEAAI